ARGHTDPGVDHLIGGDAGAEALGEARDDGQCPGDPPAVADAVVGVVDGDEGADVGVVGAVLPGRAGDRDLVSARSVRVAGVAGPRGGDAGDGGAEADARDVAAGLGRLQTHGFEAAPDLGHVLDLDPVELDVLTVRDVSGAAGEVVRDVRDRPQLFGGEFAAV